MATNENPLSHGVNASTPAAVKSAGVPESSTKKQKKNNKTLPVICRTPLITRAILMLFSRNPSNHQPILPKLRHRSVLRKKQAKSPPSKGSVGGQGERQRYVSHFFLFPPAKYASTTSVHRRLHQRRLRNLHRLLLLTLQLPLLQVRQRPLTRLAHHPPRGQGSAIGPQPKYTRIYTF